MLRHQFTLKLKKAEEISPIIERIGLVIEMLDAEHLLSVLGRERGVHGRDEYPNRVLWHYLVVCGCLGVRTATEGLRHLELSEALRQLCGITSRGALPSKHACYRFERRLGEHLDLLEEMFIKLVRELALLLPGFAERLATDSTKVHSLCNGKKPAADEDASWKKYEHSYTDEQGQTKKSVVKWFGYKLHLLADAVYELPVAFLLTTAKDNDAAHFAKLWSRGKENLPDLNDRAKSNAKDKGYDDEETHQVSWQDGVEPIVAIRKMTREENQVLLPEKQQVCADNRPLRFDGYESARKALRYDRPKGCPKVTGKGYCAMALHCSQKLIRVRLDAQNLRHLGPVPRDTKKFARLYKGRTAVERVNERLKDRWGLNCVRRRGQKRVKVWACLALLCMNAFALTMAQQGRISEVRKTVYSIAA